MATHVYANGDEISCKKSTGKTSVAFPDPCWSPPTPPAGPIVLPYPNTAKPSSLKKGTTTVMIKNSMVALERKSFFSKSNGNEPATQAFQKGVLTRKLTGKTFYQKWSMNVKFEGKGVCRHIDLMTHNHGSQTGNTATFPFLAQMITDGGQDPCSKERDKIEKECGHPKGNNATKTEKKKWNWAKEHCKGILTVKAADPKEIPTLLSQLDLKNKEQIKTPKDIASLQTPEAKNNSCLQAKKCELVPYSKTKSKAKLGNKKGCCRGQTGHHVVGNAVISKDDCPDYDGNKAPTVCVEGVSHTQGGTHEKMHTSVANLNLEHVQKLVKRGISPEKCELTLNKTIDIAAESHNENFGKQCSKSCIKAQLNSYYKNDCKCKTKTRCKPVSRTGEALGSKAIQDNLKNITKKTVILAGITYGVGGFQ